MCILKPCTGYGLWVQESLLENGPKRWVEIRFINMHFVVKNLIAKGTVPYYVNANSSLFHVVFQGKLSTYQTIIIFLMLFC